MISSATAFLSIGPLIVDEGGVALHIWSERFGRHCYIPLERRSSVVLYVVHRKRASEAFDRAFLREVDTRSGDSCIHMPHVLGLSIRMLHVFVFGAAEHAILYAIVADGQASSRVARHLPCSLSSSRLDGHV